MSVSVGKSTIVVDKLILSLDAASLQTNYSLTEVEVLVVAGGGGGGYEMGGGGGAGGLIYNSSYPVTPNTSISVTIGNGGSGRTSNADNGGIGQNSAFGNLTSIGGGAGGNNSYPYDGSNSAGRPTSGGSGGGSGEGQTRAPGTISQGNRGGCAIENGYYHSGGGGGAASDGKNASLLGGGDGGNGLLLNISGRPTYYAGGGGGGVYGPASGVPNLGGVLSNPLIPGKGGLGGGGNAGPAGNVGTAGKANTGGGGGGGSYSPSSAGGAGGSGVVIVRYPGPQKATGGNTITQVDGYTIHTFTSSGTFTPFISSPSDGATAYGLQDLVGNSCAASVGTPTYSTDGGGSISFNGVDQSMKISKPYPDPVGLYSWEVWYKLSALGSNRTVLGPHKGNAFTLSINETNSYTWADQSVYSYATYGTRTATGIGQLNVWKHVIVTKDLNNDVRLYINGSLIDTRSAFGSPLQSNKSSTTWLWGYSDTDSIGSNTNMGVGKISIVRMYNKTLSLTEILKNFNAQRGRFGI